MGANAALFLLFGAFRSMMAKRFPSAVLVTLLWSRNQVAGTPAISPLKIRHAMEMDPKEAYSRGFRLMTRNGKSQREMV